jgi:hypothetical protein
VFQAHDPHGLASSLRSVTITVLERQTIEVNHPPTSITLLASSVDENAAGAVIGIFQVADPDVGQTHSVILDDGRFTVVDQQLQLNPSFQLDFETEPQVVIVASARDPGIPPQSVSATFTISVRDMNDPPRDLRLSNDSAPENLLGLAIGTLSVEDQDRNQVHTFSVTDPRFEIADRELRLKSDQVLRLADGNDVVLDVLVKDNGTSQQTLSSSVTIRVTANEHPWQNQSEPNDVNRDGHVAPIDALNVINLLNNPTSLGAAGQLPSARPENSPHLYDVNGDNSCTPNDALRIINALNRSDPSEGEAEGFGESTARILFATSRDPFGNATSYEPLSSVAVCCNFADLEMPQPVVPSISTTADRAAVFAACDDVNWELESLLDALADEISVHALGRLTGRLS